MLWIHMHLLASNLLPREGRGGRLSQNLRDGGSIDMKYQKEENNKRGKKDEHILGKSKVVKSERGNIKTVQKYKTLKAAKKKKDTPKIQ